MTKEKHWSPREIDRLFLVGQPYAFQGIIHKSPSIIITAKKARLRTTSTARHRHCKNKFKIANSEERNWGKNKHLQNTTHHIGRFTNHIYSPSFPESSLKRALCDSTGMRHSLWIYACFGSQGYIIPPTISVHPEHESGLHSILPTATSNPTSNVAPAHALLASHTILFSSTTSRRWLLVILILAPAQDSSPLHSILSIRVYPVP